MAIETINGTLQLTRLTNESAEYTAPGEELRLAEIELMRQRERVAAMRRASSGWRDRSGLSVPGGTVEPRCG